MKKETGDKKGTAEQAHEYRVGNRVFVVTPIYREDSGKTVYDALLNLMKKDSEKH